MALLAGGADPNMIASQALDAAETAFMRAGYDEGFKYTVWLLTRATLAAREKDFSRELSELGMDVPKDPGLFDILGAFTRHIDAYLNSKKARTDISEMSQLAAVETLSEKCMERSRSLFGTTPADVQRAMRDLSTQKNFGLLARDFFSRFAYRYLNYFLSRKVPKHVGPNGGFKDIDQHTAFNEALAVYCRQSAAIVQYFAGEWYSKTAYETGITQEKAGA